MGIEDGLKKCKMENKKQASKGLTRKEIYGAETGKKGGEN